MTTQALKKTQGLSPAKYREALNDLSEELETIIQETGYLASTFVIETNHKIGEAIVNHSAYKKGAHGSGNLIKDLALRIGKSEQHLYFCIKFYENYPKVSNALETLQGDYKTLTWRHVVASLSGNVVGEDCGHEETYVVRYLCCRKCGSRIKDKI